MSDIVKHINNAKNDGLINVYAIRYMLNHRGSVPNFAVALPGNMDFDFKTSFCNSIVEYQDFNEVQFNPTLNGLEDGTYEYLPLANVREKVDEILGLIDESVDYCGKENRKKVSSSNLYIGKLLHNGRIFYLCAKQGHESDKLLKGKVVFFRNQDNLCVANPAEVFLISFCVSFLIDIAEDKILIFDKKAFQDVFKYDDYLMKSVQSNISEIDKWHFLESVDFIKGKCSQKNVYRNLAKVFSDNEYKNQISSIEPRVLKTNLLTMSSNIFRKEDFDGDKLVVNSRNLDVVMKMLAKRFKFNFFTNNAE